MDGDDNKMRSKQNNKLFRFPKIPGRKKNEMHNVTWTSCV